MTLILKPASANRTSGEWSDDDFDVLADGVVVGRIIRVAAVPVGVSSFGQHEERWPTTATSRRGMRGLRHCCSSSSSA